MRFPIYDGTQEYCLWLGCMGSYDPRGREIILSLIEVFRYLGVTFGVLKKEKCTGDPVRRLGNDYLFTELAENNLEQIKSARRDKMISICPHCVRTIGEDWKEAGAMYRSSITASFSHGMSISCRKDRRIGRRSCFMILVIWALSRMYDEPRDVVERIGLG